MTDWLALALAEMKALGPDQGRVPKWSKSTKSPDNVYFVDFGTFGTRSANDIAVLEERTAMALQGGVPAIYAEAFSVLQLCCPDGLAEAEWRQTIQDAGLFLDQWGAIAEGLGWRARDILSPTAAQQTLAWVLQGAYVTSLTATAARLSDGRIFIRDQQRGSHDEHS